MICHIITTLEPGGAEKQLLELATGIKRYAFTQKVIYLKGEGVLSPKFSEIDIQVIKLKPSSFSAIKNLIKSKDIVLHSHLPRAEIVGYLISLLFRKKFIVTRHNAEMMFAAFGKKVSKHLSRIVLNRAYSIVCISREVQKYLIQNEELRSTSYSKSVVIHYGVSLPNSIVVPKRFDSSKELQLMTAMRMVPQKDYTTLLNAVKNVTLMGHRVRLHVYGDGESKESLKLFSEVIGIRDNLIFHGVEKNLESMYRNYDLFVLSTNYEGFGLVLLEAARQGLPFLCSDIPVLREIWEEEVFFFEQGNALDLANKIVRFCVDSNFELDLSNKSAEALNKYAIEFAVKKHIDLYLKCLKGRQ